ncbi:hypothetical protein PG997_009106 [Apiospora hydei]|uniref:Peptidase M12A domain-containing protein n=1 Tax=Apiospora hydei TaxID=1337664 RepID=A0ABR1VT55_9PEZI
MLIRFKFLEHGNRGPSTIRISFTSTGPPNSRLGLWRKDDDPNEPTMRLRVVFSEPLWSQFMILHEFRHALGLEHQHQHPNSGIRWNKSELKRQYRYTDDVFRRNYATLSSLAATCYDPRSIMHYRILPGETYNRAPWSAPNSVLSVGDKMLLMSLYPSDKPLILAPGLVLDPKAEP